MYPQAADQVRQYADGLARCNWIKHQYRETAALAAESLELKPGQPEALAMLAQSQFALANFPAAADAYRKLLDQNASDIEFMQAYADASAAGPMPQAARDFEAWQARVKPSDPAFALQLRVEMAGLMLMAGNEAPARALIQEAQAPGSTVAPEFVGRLGWWYYRAGKYDLAWVLVSQATAIRPANLSMQTTVAWIELQDRRLADAIRRFTAIGKGSQRHSPVMGRAIARWQAHQTDDALKDFAAAMKDSPEWTNPRWVQTLFPATAAQSVAEMDAECHRRQAALRSSPQPSRPLRAQP